MYAWQDTWVDYYEVLGIPRASTLTEIKSAFRKKAYDWHPDRLPKDAAQSVKDFADKQFKLCNNANAALTDVTEKAEYDREWDKRNKAKSASSSKTTSSGSATGSSSRTSGSAGSTTGKRTSSSASGSKTSSDAGRSTPPPKDYYPIVDVDTNDIRIEVEQGKPVSFSFVVRHVSGELPPKWTLGIEITGIWLDKAKFSMNPPDSFPTKISINLPPQPVGDFNGSITISVEEIK